MRMARSAEGAVTPDPGDAGVVAAWLACEAPLGSGLDARAQAGRSATKATKGRSAVSHLRGVG
jgi:hypothetical protein